MELTLKTSGDVGGLVFVPLTIPFLEAAFGEAGLPERVECRTNPFEVVRSEEKKQGEKDRKGKTRIERVT